MKNFLESKGQQELFDSKDTSRRAFNLDLISNGDIWMDMISSRNLSSHTYDEETADAILEKIINHYFKAFESFEQTMLKHKQNNEFWADRETPKQHHRCIKASTRN